MTKYNHHQGVMITEVVSILVDNPKGIYIDCTLGRAGHTLEILKKIDKDGLVIGIDKDQTAIQEVSSNTTYKNLVLVHNDFKNIKAILTNLKVDKVDGFLFDLGVSSPQLDDPTRGFSYRNDARLDMRMDQTQKLDAYTVVNKYDLETLNNIFKKYGECKDAYKIAKAIVKIRELKPIETTTQLVNIITENISKKYLHTSKHPARTFFQAIRIEVNQELSIIESTIKTCVQYLKPGAKIAIITFHSLEDRIVKHVFNDLSISKIPNYLPIKDQVIEYQTIKTIKPTPLEISHNNRSRSAKLRVLQKRS